MMSRRSLKVFHEALIAQQINNLKQWIWAVMLASTIYIPTYQFANVFQKIYVSINVTPLQLRIMS